MSEGQIIWAMMWTCVIAAVPRGGRAIFDPWFYALSGIGWAIAWAWGVVMP